MHLAVACAVVLALMSYVVPNFAAAQGTSTGTGGGRSERGDGKGPSAGGNGNSGNSNGNSGGNSDGGAGARNGADRNDRNTSNAGSQSGNNAAVTSKPSAPDTRNPAIREIHRAIDYMAKTHGRGGNPKQEGIKSFESGMKMQEKLREWIDSREKKQEYTNPDRIILP